MDCEVLAEMLVDQTELLFRHGPHKLIGKSERGVLRAPLSCTVKGSTATKRSQ